MSKQENGPQKEKAPTSALIIFFTVLISLVALGFVLSIWIHPGTSFYNIVYFGVAIITLPFFVFLAKEVVRLVNGKK